MDGFESKTAGRSRPVYPLGDRKPEVGARIEVAPNIHWLRMPLPFSLKWINLWLIDDGDGWTIVDTGMPTEKTKAAWRRHLDEALEGRPVHRIIVTHMHPDHVGNAGWLRRKTGAAFWMTRLEYLTCRTLVADTGREAPEAGVRFYRRAGWDEAAIARYRERFGGFGRAVSRLPDSYNRLEDGMRLSMAGRDWRVVTGNGHSPEHACLYCAELNVLIAGDQLLPRISSNVSVFPTEPNANPLADWLASCDKLKLLVPADTLVLPAHNEPFTGAHDRLQALIDGHHKALERLLKRLREAPRRVIDVFPAIFGRKIDADLLSMATGEALAHLNYLVASGDARVEDGPGGVALYSAA